MLKLPQNNQFTFTYCNQFSSVFVCDGKYFNVATDTHDWVFLWGFDYFRHDIPVFSIAPYENYSAWSKFFFHFRLFNHRPELLVCDDNTNLKLAALRNFPLVKIQTCYNHFKENIRRDLKIRSDKTEQYKDFMKRIESILNSSEKHSTTTFNNWLWCLYRDYQSDPICLSVLLMIEKYKKQLLAYRGIPQAPLTTNIIEGFNSHLEKRLFSLCSFQTVQHARLWFNGYVLKRRMTKYTDCRGKFRYMNGKTGVQMTKKPDIVIPSYF